MSGDDSDDMATTTPQVIGFIGDEDVARTARTATIYPQIVEILGATTTITSPSPYGRRSAVRLKARDALLLDPLDHRVLDRSASLTSANRAVDFEDCAALLQENLP
jgi:hypothetical protein